MSRSVVRVGSFLLLSLALISSRAFSGEPPKKVPPKEDAVFGDADPFGPAPKVPSTVPLDEDPFGGETRTVPAKPAGMVGVAAKAAAAKLAPPANVKPKPSAAPKLHGGEKAILKALKQKVSFEFVETPLNDVVDYLSKKYRIPIIRDFAGLKDAGVDESTPITCKLSGISLQSALEIILDELQLRWVIHHDVLMITSPQKAESDEFAYTKLYDVTDLVIPMPDASVHGTPLSTSDALHLDSAVRGIAPSQPQPTMMRGLGMQGGWSGPVPVVGMGSTLPPTVAGGTGIQPRSVPNYITQPVPEGANFQQLIDLIENTVSQKSWTENGGNGAISEMQPGFLVVSQTREVHQQIKQLLADLRARRMAPAFRVELHWLWLDAAHRDALFTPGGKRSTGHASRAIDPQRLLQIAREVPGFHAQTNCLNGGNGVVAAGDRRALIVDAIPAVDGGIAYQPIVSMPNVGVAANVQPILLPGAKLARLTVRTSITRWMPACRQAVLGAAWPAGSRARLDLSRTPANASTTGPTVGAPLLPPNSGGGFFAVASENVKTAPPAAPATAQPAAPATTGTPQASPTQPSTANPQSAYPLNAHASFSAHGGGSASCPIDLPVMPTQEFGTTLRVPLGKPVVVGSVTFAPVGDAGLGAARQDPVEVYLIATTSIVKQAKR
jgi:hypothetical protein